MVAELFKQGICKVVEPAFFDIFGIFAFSFLLYMGIKFSKYKLKYIRIGGYLLIVISTIGLVVDLYNVIYKYLI